MPNNKKNRNVKNIEKNNNGLPSFNINWLITIYLTPLRNSLFTRFCEN